MASLVKKVKVSSYIVQKLEAHEKTLSLLVGPEDVRVASGICLMLDMLHLAQALEKCLSLAAYDETCLDIIEVDEEEVID